MKILVADDEPSIRTGLRYTLKSAGHTVIEAADSKQALLLAEAEDPDLFLLDVMMPEMNGFELLEKLRQNRKHADKIIIMLTARNETGDIVSGLTSGADDYMVKPFNPIELLARIQATSRRRLHPGKDHNIIRRDPLVIDLTAHTATIAGQPLSLTNKEFELLRLLAADAGKLFSRDELIEAVWGLDQYGESRALDTHIKTLRKKLAADPAIAGKLVSIRGAGYKFEI